MASKALSADQASYELVREYSYLSRRKMQDVVSECLRPLEARLEEEFGVKPGTKRRKTRKRKAESK